MWLLFQRQYAEGGWMGIAAPPEFIRRWVEEIRKVDAQTGGRTVDQYILDNEPALWNSSHTR